MAYLTFEILSSGKIVWTTNNTNITFSTIEYRKNGGEWASITSTCGGTDINVVTGDILEFRGDNPAYSDGNRRFGMFGDGKTTAQFKAKGNIMSLINSTDFENLKSFTSAYTFRALFNNCSTLMDVSELILPATGLTTGCYRFMFQNCTSITTSPKLPATALVSECYQGMFQGCSKLNNIECLATSVTASNCTYQWVSGVSSTGIFIKNPDITESSWGRGISKIPSNWTVQDKTFFSVEPELLVFNNTGGTQTVTLTSESTWTATAPSWVTLSTYSGSGDAQLSVGCSSNEGFYTRVSSVVFTDGENTATLTVSQKGDKTIILKNLYRNGNKVPMMFRNGELIYQMLEIVPEQPKVLPNKTFVFNYNAKNYDANTYTIPNENGATLQENMVWSATTSSVRNNISFNLDHITIPASAFSAFIYSTTGDNPMNITNAEPSMTMIVKARTTAGTNSQGVSQPITGTNSYNIFSNRSNTDGYNLLFRSNNKSWIICGDIGYDASPYSVEVATATTVTLLLRINNKQVEIKNLTTGVSNTPFTPTFNNPTRIFSFFSSFFTVGNGLGETTSGDFYWCYASREVLTDAEVQQVVDFNEN